MVARILSTLVALGLAGGAYFGVAPAAPGVNLLFVFLLFVAFLLWFEWETIEAGYSYLDEGEGPSRRDLLLPLTRFAPLLRRTPPRPKDHPEEPQGEKGGSEGLRRRK